MDSNLNSAQVHLKAWVNGLYDSCKGVSCLIRLDKLENKRAQQNSTSQYTVTPIRRKYRIKKEESQPSRQNKKRFGYYYLQAMGVNAFTLFVYIVIDFILSLATSFYVQLFTVPLKYVLTTAIVVFNKMANFITIGDMADIVTKYCLGNSLSSQTVTYILIDGSMSAGMHWIAWQQALLLRPCCTYLGEAIYWIHLCLLCSSYCFEYKWSNLNWPLFARLDYIEKHWPYFLGFGAPLAFLTEWSASYNIVASMVVFALSFPFFIVSAYLANPIVGVSDFSLRIFWPVTQLCDIIYRILLIFRLGRNTPEKEDVPKQKAN